MLQSGGLQVSGAAAPNSTCCSIGTLCPGIGLMQLMLQPPNLVLLVDELEPPLRQLLLQRSDLLPVLLHLLQQVV